MSPTSTYLHSSESLSHVSDVVLMAWKSRLAATLSQLQPRWRDNATFVEY